MSDQETIDQLRSQLEASQAECAHLNRELGKRFDLEKIIDERDDDLNGLKCDLEKAQAECDRMRKDKERLDWLAANPSTLFNCTWMNANVGRCFSFSRGDDTIGECAESKRPLRAAIDAAMQPVSGEEKL